MRRVFTLLLIIFAIITACLGVWQISRGFEKKALYLSYSARQDLDVINLSSEQLSDDAFENRRVKVTAQPFITRRVYVENVTQASVPGYLVVEFAQLEDYGVFALIRGFVPVGQDRRFLPQLQPSPEFLELEGIIRGYSDRVLSIGDAPIESFGNELYRIQYLERAVLEEIAGIALADRVVYKTAPIENGFGYLWPAPKSTESHRSFSYAVQWFLMCFAAISFLVVMRLSGKEGVQNNE